VETNKKTEIEVAGQKYLLSDWESKNLRRQKQYDNRELTEEQRQATKAYWEKVYSNTPSVRLMTYEEARNYVLARGRQRLQKREKHLRFTPELARLYRLLALYHTGNPEFETLAPGYSLHKGLYLAGSYGTGKSFAMGLFCNHSVKQTPQLRNAPVESNFVSSLFIGREYRRTGDEIIKAYTDDCVYYLDREKKYHTVTFDELSDKPEGKNYGNTVNVLQEILEARYYTFVNHGQITHITTNITSLEDFVSLYGGRMGSRYREMFNVVYIEGIDLRQ